MECVDVWSARVADAQQQRQLVDGCATRDVVLVFAGVVVIVAAVPVMVDVVDGRSSWKPGFEPGAEYVGVAEVSEYAERGGHRDARRQRRAEGW